MKKYSTLLLSALLLLGFNCVCAAQIDSSDSFDAAVKKYNFEDNSYNVSDEQLLKQTDTDILQQDRKVSFWKKVVNSGHFSSNTATKTWIPLNKDIEP